MNIYDAIMKAADHIEQNPGLYDFFACRVPECGTPGCMLGWIGYFAGVKPYSDVLVAVAKPLLGYMEEHHGDHPFYERISEFTPPPQPGRRSSYCNADVAASALRRYAETYHGPEKPKAITLPNWKTIAASPLIPDHVRSEEVA